jgi:hypothetical protein
VQDDLDLVTVPAECLVDRVVDDLPEAVHEAPRVRRSDVHAGSLAHRLEAFEDGEMPGGVVAAHLSRVVSASDTPMVTLGDDPAILQSGRPPIRLRVWSE